MSHPLPALLLTAGLTLAAAPVAAAAEEPASAPAPVTLGAPAMSPPLTLNPNPISFDTGVIGKVYVSGQITGLGLAQSDRAPFPGSGNATSLLDASNAMVAVQTISGPLQVFVQAGAYSFPTLGTPYIRASKNPSYYYGDVPVAYGKLVVNSSLSVQAGQMPTLIGSEYAFTFQNTNIERGLLWNQEPVISRGVQVNYAKGPVNLQVSVNDGFYSDHYNWFSGLLSYTLDSHNTVAVNGGLNFAHTLTNKFAAPNTQNNSSLILASWTYSNGPLWISPYVQYTTVPGDERIGLSRGAQTYAGAVLAKYTVTPEVNLAGRFEYIATSSDRCRPADGPLCAPTNLLYGPGSNAWTLTVTPTWQRGVLFARGEVSYVRIESLTPGFGFGSAFDSRDQVRGLFEVGVLF